MPGDSNGNSLALALGGEPMTFARVGDAFCLSEIEQASLVAELVSELFPASRAAIKVPPGGARRRHALTALVKVAMLRQRRGFDYRRLMWEEFRGQVRAAGWDDVNHAAFTLALVNPESPFLANLRTFRERVPEPTPGEYYVHSDETTSAIFEQMREQLIPPAEFLRAYDLVLSDDPSDHHRALAACVAIQHAIGLKTDHPMHDALAALEASWIAARQAGELPLTRWLWPDLSRQMHKWQVAEYPEVLWPGSKEAALERRRHKEALKSGRLHKPLRHGHNRVRGASFNSGESKLDSPDYLLDPEKIPDLAAPDPFELVVAKEEAAAYAQARSAAEDAFAAAVGALSTAERNEKMRELDALGFKRKHIAELFGVSAGLVTQALGAKAAA